MHGIEHMRLFRALALVAGAFILLVHAAGAQGVSPTAVVDSYERAWGEQNVDAAMAMLTDDAIITLQDARTRALKSPRQIREFLANSGVQAVPVLTSMRQVEGGKVTWSERINYGQSLNAPDVTVEAMVVNGKIQSLVYRPGRLVSAGQPASTQSSDVSRESAAMALAAVLLLGLGLLSLAGVRRRVISSSQLRGRLLRDLHHWHSRASAV
jgi:hypothetical protein